MAAGTPYRLFLLNMKKLYNQPVMQVVVIRKLDIITGSQGLVTTLGGESAGLSLSLDGYYVNARAAGRDWEEY